MSKNNDQSEFFRDRQALRRLINDLNVVDGQTLPTSVVDNEMLSLIVDEAVKGIDVAQRYPDFYKKLLENSSLRETFLDALESIEHAEKDEIRSSEKPLPDLGFLGNLPPAPSIEKSGENWLVSWQRTVDQLRAIFTPISLATRSDSSLFDDSWFILLSSDVEIEGALYSVLLECTLSDDNKALSPYLHLAIGVTTATERAHFPILTTLQWGAYAESIQFFEEGRARFPNIPLQTIFDEQQDNISSALILKLQPKL